MIETLITLAFLIGPDIDTFARQYKHLQAKMRLQQVQTQQQELMIEQYSNTIEILEAIKKIEK